MILLELFCGTKSMGKVFKKYNAEVFSIDFDAQHNPDLCIDILDFTTEMLPEKFRNPTAIWASPPCTVFSIAGLSHHWHKNEHRKGHYLNYQLRPKSPEAIKGIAIVEKTLQIINELKPKYWFMENPCGKLRKLSPVASLHRKHLTYCQYGDKRQKPTDIWTNAIEWQPKPKCKRGAPCHEAAPRGSNQGTEGEADKVKKSIIPEGLCEEIYQVCSGKLVYNGITQRGLFD